MHSFVKNSGLGFAIPYLHSGTGHDYMPDFIATLAHDHNRHVIVETKGLDDRLAQKSSAARRWAEAINRDGRFGKWSYLLLQDRARIAQEIADGLAKAASEGKTGSA